MAVIMTGVLMTAVDTTIVVLALPEIQRGLHVTLSAVVWVIISFLLVITLLATQVGRLGDMFGRVRMYEMGSGMLRTFANIGMVFSNASHGQLPLRWYHREEPEGRSRYATACRRPPEPVVR